MPTLQLRRVDSDVYPFTLTYGRHVVIKARVNPDNDQHIGQIDSTGKYQHVQLGTTERQAIVLSSYQIVSIQGEPDSMHVYIAMISRS